MEASAGDHLETVKLLPEKGADVNEQTVYGTRALKKAIDYGQADVMELLLEKGAEVIMLSASARDLDPAALRQAIQPGT
jgi:ankyrin repeat protein